MGDESFREILRAWNERHRYGNVSTTDFVALAEEFSGMDLDVFFEEWLYDDGRLPELPPPAVTAAASG